ncbi:hydroxyacylglutathione hydrolase [Arenimonas fontis]|uniref:hydroxyacylglutathione hydrolase n=1 Tax=Arenimonas fontis TaxID=2608255 RepID=UPI001AEF0381|nr:hydroxyacylglutathione hydrolase [Arenimonas fontis]
MHATPLPALEDNYIWLLTGAGGDAVVVDPGEAAPVLDAVARGLRPVAILVTHHHPDHIGGIRELRERFDLPVYAPVEPRIGLDDCIRVREGDRVDLPALGLALQVMEVPGHTLSHVAYYGGRYLLCGDTLFSLGCGRLFEGTPAQMLASLDRLASLPPDTLVCCSHEYTEANGRFAKAAEPDNPARDDHLAEVAVARAAGRPSLPSSIGRERAGNPFLRLESPGIRASLSARLGRPPRDRLEAFATLRAWKDGFRG